MSLALSPARPSVWIKLSVLIVSVGEAAVTLRTSAAWPDRAATAARRAAFSCSIATAFAACSPISTLNSPGSFMMVRNEPRVFAIGPIFRNSLTRAISPCVSARSVIGTAGSEVRSRRVTIPGMALNMRLLLVVTLM